VALPPGRRNHEDGTLEATPRRSGRSSHPIADTWAARPIMDDGDSQPNSDGVLVAFDLADDALILKQIASNVAGHVGAHLRKRVLRKAFRNPRFLVSGNRGGHGTVESCSLDANCSSNITTNNSPTAGSTSRSVPVVAPEDIGQLLHNLLHDPGHGRLARGIIRNFFDSM